MRKSSKVLVFIFFIVAGGLAFFGTRLDESEIEARVEQSLPEVIAERQQALAEREERLNEQERQITLREAELQPQRLAEREAAVTESEGALTARETTLAARTTALAEQEQQLTLRAEALAERERGVIAYETDLNRRLYRRIPVDTLTSLLSRLRIDYTRETDDDGDPKLVFRLASYATKIYLYDCEDDACSNLLIFTNLPQGVTATASTLAEWNRTKRYGTAYVNKGGFVCLDTDFDFRGGATLAAFEHHLLNFRDKVVEFANYLDA